MTETELVLSAPVLEAEQPWTPETRSTTLDALDRYLSELTERVPEAEIETACIRQGAVQLIDAYQVDAGFFQDRNQAAIFTSFALMAGKLEADPDTTPAAASRRTFIDRGAFILTASHSRAHNDRLRAYANYKEQDHNAFSQALADFEQPEVSARLNDFVQTGDVIAGPRQRLNMHREDPFSFHALSVAGNYKAAGVFAGDTGELTAEEITRWEEGLERRAQEFAYRSGDDSILEAVAFTYDGSKVYAPLVTAEALIAGRALSRDIGGCISPILTIKHEFVHTQGNVALSNAFGILLEEARAKHFSGDGESYAADVKVFSRLKQLYGVSIYDLFDAAASSEAALQPNIYELIGRAYGIESIAEVAALQPLDLAGLATDAEAMHMIFALGGHKKVIDRMIRRVHGEETAAIRQKVFNYAGVLGLANFVQDLNSEIRLPNA